MKYLLTILYILSMCMRGNCETVISIIDGDTIKIKNNNNKIEIIRLIGVDSPEAKQKLGIEAKQYLTDKVLNKIVSLEKDKKEIDIYGRSLRYVFINKESINESIIKNGFGYRSYIYPNKKYDLTFIKAESEAKSKKLNIWSINDIRPKEFRKKLK